MLDDVINVVINGEIACRVRMKNVSVICSTYVRMYSSVGVYRALQLTSTWRPSNDVIKKKHFIIS